MQSFKLENTATGACLYAGVLDFTSPVAEQAFIPQWMMDHLGASDGMPSHYRCVCEHQSNTNENDVIRWGPFRIGRVLYMYLLVNRFLIF